MYNYIINLCSHVILVNEWDVDTDMRYDTHDRYIPTFACNPYICYIHPADLICTLLPDPFQP